MNNDYDQRIAEYIHRLCENSDWVNSKLPLDKKSQLPLGHYLASELYAICIDQCSAICILLQKNIIPQLKLSYAQSLKHF